EVRVARFLEKLLTHGLGLRLRMGAREFLLKLGRAPVAHVRVSVPADVRADPLSAAAALVKMLLALDDGLFEGRVVGLAADGPLDLVGRVTGGVEKTAKDASRDPERRLGHSDRRCLKLGHEAVAALVTVELELVPAVAAQVLVVLDELNHRHAGRLAHPAALVHRRRYGWSSLGRTAQFESAAGGTAGG